jgi:hypothetical protein
MAAPNYTKLQVRYIFGVKYALNKWKNELGIKQKK